MRTRTAFRPGPAGVHSARPATASGWPGGTIRRPHMARPLICAVCLVMFVLREVSGQAGPPAPLTDGDRSVVRLALELSSKERAGWSAAGAVLLDSTRPVCEGPSVHLCLSPTVLDDLTLPATIALMTPDCARVVHRSLRDSFLARNTRSLALGPSPQVGFPIVSGSEARALSADARYDRFGGRWFVEVSAPAYSLDGRSALVYVQAYPASDGFWATIRVFERRDGQWSPTRCGLNLTP